MFQSLFQDHLQGSSFALSAPTMLQLHASSFVFFGVCGRMPSICMCAWCTCLCAVWSRFARTDSTKKGTTDTHSNRGHKTTYQYRQMTKRAAEVW
jgi:hypothetical protein